MGWSFSSDDLVRDLLLDMYFGCHAVAAVQLRLVQLFDLVLGCYFMLVSDQYAEVCRWMVQAEKVTFMGRLFARFPVPRKHLCLVYLPCIAGMTAVAKA